MPIQLILLKLLLKKDISNIIYETYDYFTFSW